jgi:hypothetical protein
MSALFGTSKIVDATATERFKDKVTFGLSKNVNTRYSEGISLPECSHQYYVPLGTYPKVVASHLQN